MKKYLLSALVLLLFAVAFGLAGRGRAFTPKEQLFGVLVGEAGGVAVLRGVEQENGHTLVFMDYEGHGSNFATLIGEVETVEKTWLGACGKTVWIVAQTPSGVVRWKVESLGETWTCFPAQNVYFPVVDRPDSNR